MRTINCFEWGVRESSCNPLVTDSDNLLLLQTESPLQEGGKA